MLRLILKELWFRKINALLAAGAMAAAVALFVASSLINAAAERETTVLMRDIGYNLRIIPRETDEVQLYRQGYPSETIPQEYMQRFVGRGNITYRHLRASLRQWVRVGEVPALLVGVTAEVAQPDIDKRPMPESYEVPPGHLVVGFHAARRLGWAEEAAVDLMGAQFTVDRCLSETGSEEDATVYGNLADVQRLLNLEGRINEIQALECLCRDPNIDSIDVLRAELEQIMPEAKVIKIRDLAETRKKQRLTTESHLAFALNIVVLACAAMVGALALLNVRERRCEIGVLRALGYGSPAVGLLFVGRALVLGVIGAVAGYALGSWLALHYGPRIFAVTARSIVADPWLLYAALVATPLLAAACSIFPVSLAVLQDPARTLREE